MDISHIYIKIQINSIHRTKLCSLKCTRERESKRERDSEQKGRDKERQRRELGQKMEEIGQGNELKVEMMKNRLGNTERRDMEIQGQGVNRTY